MFDRGIACFFWFSATIRLIYSRYFDILNLTFLILNQKHAPQTHPHYLLRYFFPEGTGIRPTVSRRISPLGFSDFIFYHVSFCILVPRVWIMAHWYHPCMGTPSSPQQGSRARTPLQQYQYRRHTPLYHLHSDRIFPICHDHSSDYRWDGTAHQ